MLETRSVERAHGVINICGYVSIASIMPTPPKGIGDLFKLDADQDQERAFSFRNGPRRCEKKK